MSSEREQTVVLVTGANRGIGRGLAEAFLSRPNHTVIAAIRSDSTTLTEYKPAKGSKLVLVKIDNTSTSDPDKAVEQIKTQGIKSLDIVIANAGINPLDALLDVKDMDLEKLRHVWDVNTLSFISLFKAVYPLLKAAADEKKESPPKLVAISSKSGQIVDMESNIPAKIGTYGVSKLALNYLVRRAHFENPWLTAWVMNPGFVQTDNGNATAQLFGMGTAPHTLQQSISGLLGVIDAATRSVTSGNFYDFDGTQLAF